MPDIHLYLDNEAFALSQNLKKGEATSIFKQALKEHFGKSDNLEVINNRINILEEEQNNINSKLSFLQKKKDELKSKLKEEEEHKKSIEEKNKIRTIEIKQSFLEWAIEIDGFSQTQAEELYNEWAQTGQKEFTKFLKEKRLLNDN